MGASHLWSPGGVGEVVQRARLFAGSGVASVPCLARVRPGESVRPVFLPWRETSSASHTNAHRSSLVFP